MAKKIKDIKKTTPQEFDLFLEKSKKMALALKGIREAKGLSLRDIGNNSFSDFDHSSISLIEKGDRRLSFQFYFEYCHLLQIDPMLTYVKVFSI